MSYRIGIGYDIHAIVSGREITLGGIKILCPFSLKGHSDADVLLHSIVDSILGALGEKDIGHHFADQDQKNENRESKDFLEFALETMRRKNFSIVNLDSNIICEKPKIKDYRDQIEKNVAKIMNIDISQINLKGKTNEKLDSIGEGKAIAAQSIILLKCS